MLFRQLKRFNDDEDDDEEDDMLSSDAMNSKKPATAM